MVLFYQRSRLACWLLLPYLLWVSFATVLNASIWFLN
jgi:tryptophan-rich sensory protein